MLIGPRHNPPLCRRCGKCCQGFHLPITAQRLETLYRRWLAGNYRDDDVRVAFRYFEPVIEPGTPPGDQTLFRCRALVLHPDGTARCSIYHQRPSLCRDFPFAGQYRGRLFRGRLHPGCGFHAAVKDIPDYPVAAQAV